LGKINDGDNNDGDNDDDDYDALLRICLYMSDVEFTLSIYLVNKEVFRRV